MFTFLQIKQLIYQLVSLFRDRICFPRSISFSREFCHPTRFEIFTVKTGLKKDAVNFSRLLICLFVYVSSNMSHTAVTLKGSYDIVPSHACVQGLSFSIINELI